MPEFAPQIVTQALKVDANGFLTPRLFTGGITTGDAILGGVGGNRDTEEAGFAKESGAAEAAGEGFEVAVGQGTKGILLFTQDGAEEEQRQKGRQSAPGIVVRAPGMVVRSPGMAAPC